jgi:hypothetical protein
MTSFPRHPKRNVRPHISKPLLKFLNDLSKRGSMPMFEAMACYPVTRKTLRELEVAKLVTVEAAQA